MKKALIIVLMASCMAACNEDKPKAIALTCKDSPDGRTRAEQQAIADACFLGGKFTKSPERSW